MRDSVLWRKQSHIVMLLAQRLNISAEDALDIFYSTNTYKLLSSKESGLHLMSDLYIVEDIMSEIKSL